jgi:alkylhydroperoxidase/carboxymuconolactone decarboxylase family protein YurZ
MPSRSDYVVPMLLGAATGVIVGVLVWRYAAKEVQKGLASGANELAAQVAAGASTVNARALRGRADAELAVANAIRTQVLPGVHAQVQQDLFAAGITPQRIAEVKAVLAYAKQAGVLL